MPVQTIPTQEVFGAQNRPANPKPAIRLVVASVLLSGVTMVTHVTLGWAPVTMVTYQLTLWLTS